MKSFLKRLGPGLLFAGAAIGVSHLVQSTKAGADFGFGLLWALLLVHIFKYPFFQYGPRYAMATGESLLDGYKKLGKGVLALYYIITLATMFTIQTAVTVVTAGLASNLFGWTNNSVIWSMVITLVCLFILLIGRYKLLDSLMKYIVITLTISTILAVLIAFSNTEQVFSLHQVMPKGAIEVGFLIAFMGWMPAPLDVSVWQSLWAIEKKKMVSEYDTKSSLLDFNIGFLSTIILGAFFIALGTIVMFNSGETFDANATKFATQLITLYTKNLGDSTYFIIAIAAFAAMFSTTLTTLDASPRSMAHASELLFGKTTKLKFNFWIIILSSGTITILLFFLSEMKLLVDIATILSFITAPFYAIINYMLICSKHTPKKWHPSKPMHLLSILGILFLIGFSAWYISTR